MMSTQQPLKGQWVYSYNLSKQVYIDEHGRILDPEYTKIPLAKPVETATIQPRPIQNQTQHAAPAVPKQQQPPVERVQRRQTQPQPVPQRQRTVAPQPQPTVRQPTNSSNSVPRRPNQNRTRAPAAAPAPAPARKSQSNGWVSIEKPKNTHNPVFGCSNTARRAPVRNNTGSRNTSVRRNRSTSVSSSGSSVRSRSNSSTKRSASKAKAFERYPSYFLKRKAVVRSGPSLNTRVIANLEAGTEITTDEVNVRTIFVKDNLRKRIKISFEKTETRDGKETVRSKWGWITVETEQGKLYHRKH